MKDARNEAREWQEMGYALPPEERAEYERGPSLWPAVIVIWAALVLLVAVCVFA